MNAVIDILVVVDNALYRKELADYAGDETETILEIKNYYNLLIAMVKRQTCYDHPGLLNIHLLQSIFMSYLIIFQYISLCCPCLVLRRCNDIIIIK